MNESLKMWFDSGRQTVRWERICQSEDFFSTFVQAYRGVQALRAGAQKLDFAPGRRKPSRPHCFHFPSVPHFPPECCLKGASCPPPHTDSNNIVSVEYSIKHKTLRC